MVQARHDDVHHDVGADPVVAVEALADLAAGNVQLQLGYAQLLVQAGKPTQAIAELQRDLAELLAVMGVHILMGGVIRSAIEDYGVVGDLRTAALVGLDGRARTSPASASSLQNLRQSSCCAGFGRLEGVVWLGMS